MRQEKNTKTMFNRRYWLGLSLASATTLAAALISTGTVQAENKSIPDWASRREVGIYDPSVPDTTLLSLMILNLSRFRKHLSLSSLALFMMSLVKELKIESFFTRVNTTGRTTMVIHTKFKMIQLNKFRRI